MLSLPPALSALGVYRQFVLYKLTPSKKRPGKTDKLPVNPATLTVSNAHDPAIWVDYKTAIDMALAMGEGYGVGFTFTMDDPFFFIDIDDCLMPDGTWSPVAQEIMAMFPGAAIEVSQSGRGLHIIARGTMPEHGCKNAALGLELYHMERFVALTGFNIIGDAGTDHTAALPALIAKYFPAIERGADEDWRDGPVDEWSGITEDAALISKLLSAGQTAAQAFGNKASFADLWQNNEQVLAAAYPVQNEVDPYDRSSADAALAQHLAFWTGKDHTRMERMMRMSALVRPKWDKHPSYMQRTVSRAVSQQKNVHAKQQAVDLSKAEEPGVQFTSGPQLLFANQMVDYFDGCTYVTDQHRVLLPSGSMLKPEQFKAKFGGYVFAMDAENEKNTKNAFEAFTENQAVRFPKVVSTCFRPEIPPGTIVDEEGLTKVNTYVPAVVNRVKGDAKPFHDFMEALWGEDWPIAMTWSSSVVQNPGVKVQWALVNIGAEGNGKSFFSSAMAFAVGSRYTHYPNAADIDNKFNGWTANCLLAVLEELTLHERHEVLEILKPLITNLMIEIQGKGSDQRTGDNRLSLIINSNHIGAIPITVDSRRYCMMHCKQQSAADIERDFPNDALKKLYDWANNENGWAIMAEEFHTFVPVAKYDPCGAAQRAPVTSSTHEAVQASQGGVEQEIREAIENGQQGFSNGWVSGAALDKLLKAIRADRKIPHNKRRAVMQSLGYDWHPALKDGRVNNVIAVEGGKPKLYIKHGHIHANLTTGAEVVKHYMTAQDYPDMMMNATETLK